MTLEGVEDEMIAKDWFEAVNAYSENSFNSPIAFLNSDIAEELGLSPEDLREFKRAVQSCDTKWQAAASAYVQGKFTTRKKFLSSAKFLRLGFSPSREHGEVLRFALKFYEEEERYRQTANSTEVSTAGRYGGSFKPMHAVTKTTTPHRVVGFDLGDVVDIPELVDLNDDHGSESVSRLSGDSSVVSFRSSKYIRQPRHEPSYVETLLQDLGVDRADRNPVDAIMFFVFAIIPLVAFARFRAVGKVILPLDFLWDGIKNTQIIDHPVDIEDEWEKLRADALLLDC